MNTSSSQKPFALHTMPGVFTLSGLVRRADKDSEWARVRVNRWKEQGVLRMAGPKTGVYYNLMRHPEAATNEGAWESGLMARAIAEVFPAAVLIGTMVMRQEGWLHTEMPEPKDRDEDEESLDGDEPLKPAIIYYRLSPPVVAVLPSRTRPQMDGVLSVTRSHEWFSTHGPFRSLCALPSLKAEQAWNDLRRQGVKDGLLVPDPDDVHIPDQGTLELGPKKERRMTAAPKARSASMSM